MESKLRNHRYRIINCTSTVKSMISRCVASRQFRGKVFLQNMGDLPSDGLTQEPRFTFCGIDMFKPFMVKDSPKQRKCYGAIFRYMPSRVVQIKTINSMSTDSLILALRRLISRRWNVRMIHTNN